MTPAAVKASAAGTTESSRAVEPAGATVDEPLVAVPASRISVEARGAALGILAALALIFVLSWGEKFMVPLLLGIVIAYTLTFVTTWMIGRIAGMNPAAIFIALLFWGWLWGIWGMLLSIPIIVIVKVVSQHVEQLQPLAELLGD